MALQDFQEGKKTDKLIFSWPVIMSAGFLCAVALFGISKVLITELALKKEIKELESKISEADVSRKIFEEKLAALRTKEGIDREARGKFNLKKPGEEIVVFVGDTQPEKSIKKTGLASVWDRLKKWLNF